MSKIAAFARPVLIVLKESFNEAIVFSNNNIKVEKDIYYMPIYMIMFLHSNFNIERKEKINLSNLSSFLEI